MSISVLFQESSQMKSVLRDNNAEKAFGIRVGGKFASRLDLILFAFSVCVGRVVVLQFCRTEEGLASWELIVSLLAVNSWADFTLDLKTRRLPSFRYHSPEHIKGALLQDDLLSFFDLRFKTAWEHHRIQGALVPPQESFGRDICSCKIIPKQSWGVQSNWCTVRWASTLVYCCSLVNKRKISFQMLKGAKEISDGTEPHQYKTRLSNRTLNSHV